LTKEPKTYIENKWHWENCLSTRRRLKVDYYFSPCTKMNSKWSKDLHAKPETTTGKNGENWKIQV
jgi:hypothetical protein